MANTFDELIASQSPGSSGFSRESGEATLPLFVLPGETTTAISTLLGTVQRGTDGRLVRTPPVSHPQWPWMTCDRISNIQGIGRPTKASAIQPVGGVALAYFASYPLYKYTCHFRHEPWSGLKDAAVEVKDATYYDDDGNEAATQYATEYVRFTSFEFKPQVEIVTATYGFQKFRRQTTAAPDGYAFPGSPRVYVAKSALVFTWHFVPVSLVFDPKSRIISQLGRVNQLEFLGFAPGQLLYSAAGVRRYTPPVPESVLTLGGVTFSTEYMCDLQFIFELTDREATDPPTAANGNWVANHHNCYPWYVDKNFYYVTSIDGADPDVDTDDTAWTPTYKSFVVQELWTDPVILP